MNPSSIHNIILSVFRITLFYFVLLKMTKNALIIKVLDCHNNITQFSIYTFIHILKSL